MLAISNLLFFTVLIYYRSIVRPRSESVTRRVEFDRVYVRFVALETLDTLARPHVPYKCHLVTSLR